MSKLWKKLASPLGREKDELSAKELKQRLARIERRQHSILALLQMQQFPELRNSGPALRNFSVYSQRDEDGQILKILANIGAIHRTFFEVGVQDGMECNTANLAFNFGWRGALVEGDPVFASLARRNYAAHPVAIVEQFVTRENINAIVRDAKVDSECDVFSLDIDGNDYWIWEALDNSFRPRIAVIEYNPGFGPERSVTIPYDPKFCVGANHPRIYRGASLTALTKLAAKRGYALVSCAEQGPNVFFVRSDALRGEIREVRSADVYRATHLKRFPKSAAVELNTLPVVEV